MYSINIKQKLKQLDFSRSYGRNGLTKIGIKVFNILDEYNISLPKDIGLVEFIYQILNDIPERPKCKICNHFITKYQIKTGKILYQKYCSQKCYKADPEINDNISKIKTKLYSNSDWKTKTENKKKQTNLQNFGVEHAMQNPESQLKQLKSCFKNGTSIDNMYLIGYEPYAYEFLKHMYHKIYQGSDYLQINNIKLHWYDDFGKLHISIPDFYIEEENMFVEIKSLYTRKEHDYKIMKAKDACNKLGFGYSIITIIPKRGVLPIRYIVENFVT